MGRAGHDRRLISFLLTFGPNGTTYELPRGGVAIEVNALDTMGQSKKLQAANADPVYIDLVPTQAMTR